MRTHGLSALILISLSHAIISAATYYVDPAVGNNANAGTSQVSPWKNIPGTRTANNSGLYSSAWGAINGSTKLGPGDIVEIKAGSNFTSANSGRIEITSAFYAGNSNPVTIRCSSTWGTGNCTWIGTGITLPDSSYPLFYIQASNVTMTGSDAAHKIVVQNSIGYGLMVNPSGGNPHSQNVHLNWIHVTATSGFGSVDWSNTDSGGMDNFEINNNDFNGLTVGGGSDQNTINLLFQNGSLHNNGLKSENVNIRQGNGAVAVGATNVTFKKVSSFANKQDGFDNGSSGNNFACSATFDGVSSYDNGEDGIGANGGPNSGNIAKWKYFIINSVLQNNAACGLDAYAGGNIEIYHTVFAGNGSQQYFGGNIIVYSSNDEGVPNITTIKLRNNIFYKPGQGSVSNVQIYTYNSSGITTNIDSDYNIFFPKNAAGDRISEYPFGAEWTYDQTPPWFGAHDKKGAAFNPGFVAYNATSFLTSDFHLSASTSPAINSGLYFSAPAALLIDRAGNTRGNPPDLGAYEFGGVTLPPPPADTQAPTVAISSPAASATVSGTVTVSANASDNVGVVGVQFLVDGVVSGAEDLSSPYSLSWNTVGLANGAHSLTAKARDAAGNTQTSTAVAVTVNNVAADTTAPTVAISAPVAGATVSETASVTATASDNVGVVGVQFLVDGVVSGAEDLSSPYSISWNTMGLANGSHSLTAKARDAAGNAKISTAVSVTVNNAVTTGIIVDNGLAGSSFTGLWSNSAIEGFYGTRSVYSYGGTADTYRFTPTIQTSGQYDVYYRYCAHANRSASVPIKVVSTSGTVSTFVNQKINGNVWILHGRYQLNAGTGNYLEISALNGQANADAARFVLVSTTPPPVQTAQSLFTTQTPAIVNANDGVAYELGMKFKSSKAGQITTIRYFKASSDTGTHIGTIWSSTGAVLARVTFAGETASGWQLQNLSAPLTIAAGTIYTVSVNSNAYYVDTLGGLASSVINGALSSMADGNNGVYGAPGAFPASSYQNSNYFRDIVFVPAVTATALKSNG